MVKNADSGSFGFRRRSPGISISMQHLSPSPRRPGSETTRRKEAWGRQGRGPRPAGDWGVVLGGVELIGVRAQTGWALDETRGDPSLHQVNDIQQGARKPPTSPRCLLLPLGSYLRRGCAPSLPEPESHVGALVKKDPCSALNPWGGDWESVFLTSPRWAFLPWLAPALWGFAASCNSPSVRLPLTNPRGLSARRAFLYFFKKELFSSNFPLIFKLWIDCRDVCVKPGEVTQG